MGIDKMRMPGNLPGGLSSPAGKYSGWVSFVLGAVLLAGVVFLFIYALGLLPAARPIYETIRENNINAGEIYYADMVESREADNYLRNAQKFRPEPIPEP